MISERTPSFRVLIAETTRQSPPAQKPSKKIGATTPCGTLPPPHHSMGWVWSARNGIEKEHLGFYNMRMDETGASQPQMVGISKHLKRTPQLSHVFIDDLPQLCTSPRLKISMPKHGLESPKDHLKQLLKKYAEISTARFLEWGSYFVRCCPLFL